MSRRVRGHKEASRALRELGKAIGPPLNEASRYALRPMLREAKNLISVDSGDTKRNLIIRRDGKAPKHSPHHAITARAPFFALLHLLEFGRAPNADGKGGYAGTRFLTRAFESTKVEVVRRFGDRLGPAIEKRAAKLRTRTR